MENPNRIRTSLRLARPLHQELTKLSTRLQKTFYKHFSLNETIIYALRHGLQELKQQTSNEASRKHLRAKDLETNKLRAQISELQEELEQHKQNIATLRTTLSNREQTIKAWSSYAPLVVLRPTNSSIPFVKPINVSQITVDSTGHQLLCSLDEYTYTVLSHRDTNHINSYFRR